MLNQVGPSDFSSTTNNKLPLSNPLNHDHDYCSPNKHALPLQPPQNNEQYSNDNLSDSSLSSSVSSSTMKDLTISHPDSSMRLLGPKNTPSMPNCNKRAPPPPLEDRRPVMMEDHSHDQQTTGRSVRAKRARQSTSVTDKSEWIMGDEQIDSVLSEHLGHDHKEKHHHNHHNRSSKEHNSPFNRYTSSDYSSSDAESDHDSDCNSEDDPDRLWCVCQKPHDGKFMIRCDICLDWFHGHCVGVTKLMGDRFEKQGKEWFCSECKEKLAAGVPRSSIPKKMVKKEAKKKTAAIPVPGKRGRGRPRKSESLNRPTTANTRASLRSTRKSSSSLDPKLGVDNTRLKRNLARSEARSESFDQFEDGLRLKELIKERKKEFFYKRHLAEQQKAAKRNELGLGRQSLTANLSDSLDSLATSTNAPNMINLPINIKPSEKDTSKPNIVLQINTKKDSGDQKNMSSRIVTTIVRSPKKTKIAETIDPIVNDIFTAEPIQIHKKVKQEQTTSSTNNQSTVDANTSNSDTAPIKRSGSLSSTSKNGSFDHGEITTPKKKRKDSESSNLNGSTTPIGSKHIVAKIKESLETRGRQIKDLEVSSDKIEELAIGIQGQLNECFKEGTQKYLNKFRSLLFNLRDTKNQSLIKNVLTGEISPSRLVRMSAEEMASHELAKWRERENKHSIELIKRDAQLAAQQVIVKKTHKGEEVIAAPAFNEPDDPTAVLDNQEPPTTPTKQLSKDTATEVTTVVLTPPPTIGVTNSTVAPLKMKITGISSNSSPPRALSFTSTSEHFWSGSVSMAEVARFSALAKPVSGIIDFSGQELNQELSICGRIAPDQVQGYIKKIKTTTKNQIIIIQICPLKEEDRNNFDIFFDYLYSRNRYGVISAKDHPDLLKDFYVLPIHENGSIPEILKPIQGPGIDRSQTNCLLGLLVRNKRASTSSTNTTTSSYTPTPIK